MPASSVFLNKWIIFSLYVWQLLTSSKTYHSHFQVRRTEKKFAQSLHNGPPLFQLVVKVTEIFDRMFQNRCTSYGLYCRLIKKFKKMLNIYIEPPSHPTSHEKANIIYFLMSSKDYWVVGRNRTMPTEHFLFEIIVNNLVSEQADFNNELP